jgi:hypothetical protein
MAKPAKRTTWVPYATRTGTPVALPLFGPASPTREAAQARLDAALATGNFTSGEVRVA